MKHRDNNPHNRADSYRQEAEMYAWIDETKQQEETQEEMFRRVIREELTKAGLTK